MEAIAVCLEICQIPMNLCIQKQSLNLKILTASQQLACAATFVLEHSHRLTRSGRSRQFRNIHRLINVKLTFIARFIDSVIVIETIGQIAAFLNFGNQNARANRVNRPCFNIKNIILVHCHMVEIMPDGSAFEFSSNSLLIQILVESIHKLCAFLCSQDIPHLSLAKAVFMFKRIRIIRMNLEG